MKVFIVHAHPEPRSFNGALTRLAVDVLQGAGHAVQVSDLYAMRFDPVSDRRNFTSVKDPDLYRQQAEEAHAAEVDGFAPDLKAEMDKLLWCDSLILQFPLWWFSMPAVLKGWVDRVFAAGALYGGSRWYDNGVLRGRRAMVSLTTGGPSSLYSPTGLNGHIDAILYPVNHGVLRFVGFDVLPSFVAWAPERVSDEDRQRYLEEYRERLLSLETTPSIRYPRLADYDESFQLKPGVKKG